MISGLKKLCSWESVKLRSLGLKEEQSNINLSLSLQASPFNYGWKVSEVLPSLSMYRF